jgi:hypothetical protein
MRFWIVEKPRLSLIQMGYKVTDQPPNSKQTKAANVKWQFVTSRLVWPSASTRVKNLRLPGSLDV